MGNTRRDFLKYSVLAASSSLLLPPSFIFGSKKTDPNQETCRKKFEFAASEGLPDKPMSEVMGAIGHSFLEAPYKEHSLEVEGKERLVVNLQGFDCVTFVESTFALSRCIKLNKMTFEEFKKQLQLIRYRGGKINGYPSRLHYFSDWIDDNEKKGLVKNVARELGGIPYDKTINFMSTHRSSYKQLSNPANFRAVTATEAELNTRPHFFLPKLNIQDARESIQDGDIIGITTSIDGLDIIHTGMAFRLQGYLRFLHAPLSVGTIQITKRTIVDYLAIYEKHTGIMVARTVEPKT